jgi:4'-phosphopantetheinyl transferase
MIAPDVVDVTLLDLTTVDPAAVAERWLDLCTDEERARHDRYVFAKSRLHFLATRALVRSQLSRFCAIAPKDWRFRINPHGCPFVDGGPEELRFNLSNTDGLVACAITLGRDVGIDVEDALHIRDLEIADRFFSTSEAVALRALPESAQPSRFFDYWTLKESYIKACGMGLAIPLGAFSFDLSGESPRISIDDSLGDDPATWRFWLSSPTPRHRLAIAVRASGTEITLRASFVDANRLP